MQNNANLAAFMKGEITEEDMLKTIFLFACEKEVEDVDDEAFAELTMGADNLTKWISLTEGAPGLQDSFGNFYMMMLMVGAARTCVRQACGAASDTGMSDQTA